MLRPSSPRHGAPQMYTGNLIKDLFEIVARAETAARVSARTESSSAEDRDHTLGSARQQPTAQKVPATASSEPGSPESRSASCRPSEVGRSS